MRFPAVLASVEERARRPALWGAVLLFGFVWSLLWWGSGPGWVPPEGLLLPFLLGALLLLLGSVPWQWTGDDRPVAGLGPGLVLAGLWSLFLVGAVLRVIPSPPQHPMMGRGMGGRFMRGPGFVPPWQVRIWILGLASAVFGVVLGRIQAVHEAERRRAEQAELRAREAQAKALQAQLNPHVLFNAISGLAELAREDGASAEAALVKLAELLRRLLDHAGRTAAPLAQERALVEGLLAVEQFRLGDRLKVRWTWDEALQDRLAPPLLLQPLVENAIKHGIAPSRTGGELEIGLAGDRDELRLWVANTGAPFQEGRPEGTGLSNLRQRLALLAVPGELRLEAREGRTVAEVRIRPVEGAHD
jgi:hypothetical protein